MKRILVIDDDAELVAMLKSTLSDAGLIVETAIEAHEGLRLAWEQKFDIILCDIRMPDLDGPKVLGALRSDRATMRTKVILMTGDTKAHFNAKMAAEAGAQGFLLKPFHRDKLLETIHAVSPN
jgi:CheY-like chemotaxis protein